MATLKQALIVGMWFSLTALAQTAHKNATSTEATLHKIDWSKLATMIDAERSDTLSELDKIYARDNGREEPPYTPVDSLSAARNLDLSGVDKCMAQPNERQVTFGEMISRNLDVAMQPRKIFTNATIDSADPKVGYNLSPDRVPVGMLSHPLCTLDAGELAQALDAKQQPSGQTLAQMNEYISRSNDLRKKFFAATTVGAQKSAKEDFKAHQAIMMSCLGYGESLNETETKKGNELFAMLSQRSYVSKSKRPEGVAVGFDRPADYFVGNHIRDMQLTVGLPVGLSTYVDASGKSRDRYFKSPANIMDQSVSQKQKYVESKVTEYLADEAKGMSPQALHEKYFNNISEAMWIASGVYQFKSANLNTPKGDELSSNIGPCVDQWNALYGATCPIANTIAGYATALSSPGQAFNIFCGTQKLLQTFNVQIHTLSPGKTAKQNLKPDGTLKAPKDRCVHPFWKGGWAYNHFGPLSNSVVAGSVGSKSYPGNLAILTQCIKTNSDKLFLGH